MQPKNYYLIFLLNFFFFFSGENSRSTSWRASKVDSISRARRKTQGLCQVGGAIEELRGFKAILFLDVEQINFTLIYLPFKRQICTNLLSWLDLTWTRIRTLTFLILKLDGNGEHTQPICRACMRLIIYSVMLDCSLRVLEIIGEQGRVIVWQQCGLERCDVRKQQPCDTNVEMGTCGNWRSQWEHATNSKMSASNSPVWCLRGIRLDSAAGAPLAATGGTTNTQKLVPWNSFTDRRRDTVSKISHLINDPQFLDVL